ncbi:ATPase [Tropicimonas sp. S265A]|uniref:ATPase n=1 Tax=Tropicimonas sp. S265A TaxID=3415134 RepID=UPI003C7D8161
MNQHMPPALAPARPRSIADLGLPATMLQDILLKTMFRRSLERASELSEAMSIPVPLVQDLIDTARQLKMIESLGSLTSSGMEEMRFALSDLGKARALDALAQSEYYGAVPVPLEHFAAQSERQSIKNVTITAEKLAQSMGHLVLPKDLLRHLGPAITSGRSVLLYGPPGNGKSSISNGIRDALGDHVYVPRAISYGGQIITVFDPVVHTEVESPEQATSTLRRVAGFDHRYVCCQRPAVITGGELELSMLDLSYNPVARTYTAPLQMKATGGIFIVDDLGRQAEPPQALINRWIVPMEASYDILALQSGEKFVVPFDTLVIFSTNFHPNDIFDQAALRRVFFKLKIDGPTKEEFLRIFALVAKAKKMPLDEATLLHLITKKYPEVDNVYANFHAPFLIDQMMAICNFEGLSPQMSPDLIDRAWENLYVKKEAIVH